MDAYQAIWQEKVYTEGQSKLTHINFVILNNKLCKSYVFKICQNTYFSAVKNIKFGNSCIGFFQRRKFTIYKMTSVRKLLKNITLLPADKFGNINLYQQRILLKIIHDFMIEISFMEK